MEFLKQEMWSGLLFPFPEDIPAPGVKCTSPAAPALAGGFFTTGKMSHKGSPFSLVRFHQMAQGVVYALRFIVLFYWLHATNHVFSDFFPRHLPRQ